MVGAQPNCKCRHRQAFNMGCALQRTSIGDGTDGLKDQQETRSCTKTITRLTVQQMRGTVPHFHNPWVAVGVGGVLEGQGANKHHVQRHAARPAAAHGWERQWCCVA